MGNDMVYELYLDRDILKREEKKNNNSCKNVI